MTQGFKSSILCPMNSQGLFTLSTSFTFEAAHRLVHGYSGKCRNLHGHSFRITCSIEGSDLDQYGMVKDFAEFKVLKAWCKDHWDHATLLSESDTATIEFLTSTEQKFFCFKENPTSEVIARYLLKKSEELGFPLTSVTIDETCTHSCTIRR
ncbi:MAG: 6-carboxytetrahydropterin synthase [Bdellovibrionales bacterium]|nr:6-carboxytetrahydropterin synthase [Bdellovibrionales bacterium]